MVPMTDSGGGQDGAYNTNGALDGACSADGALNGACTTDRALDRACGSSARQQTGLPTQMVGWMGLAMLTSTNSTIENLYTRHSRMKQAYNNIRQESSMTTV